MHDNSRTAPEARRRWRPRSGALAVALIAAVVLLGACGGGSAKPNASPPANTNGSSATTDSPSTSGGASSGASSPKRSGPAYAQCMRQHGVTDFPDPQGPNQDEFLIPSSVQDNPNFQSASTACAALEPQQGTGGGGSGGVSQQQLLAFAQCMRSHGEPNFPDPSPNGAVSLGGVNPNTPQFQSALQTCESQTGLQLGGNSG